MPAITEDVRDGVLRARDYAQAFLALAQLTEPAVANQIKHLELLESARALLNAASSALDDAFQSLSVVKGNGSDV